MSEYILHLAQTDEIQPVKIKTNIVNHDNKVIVSAGVRLNSDVAAVLYREFGKPCETLVELEDGFTAEMVFALFQQFTENEPSLQQISDRCNYTRVLARGITAFSRHPELLQRLNVLAIQLPDVFDQALFCAFFTILCLSNHGATQENIDNAFIAALAHDFGLLDIPPELIFKQGSLTAEEWSELQQHPKLGAEFLWRVSGVDAETIRGVLEHHELANGTGYPAGTFKNQLGEIGQLLQILDSANAIFRKHFKHRERTLHDMVPILQINTLSRGDSYTEQIIKLFNLSHATEHSFSSETFIANAVTTLIGSANEIQVFINLTANFKKLVGLRHRDLKILALLDIAKQVKSTMDTCGIINPAYLRWAEQVRDEKLEFAYRELEEVLLMAHEVKFHIHRFHRELELYLEHSTNEILLEAVKALKLELKTINQAYASDDVIEFLDGK